MTYYVTVENGAANYYTATVIGWPNCVAEGATREEAITRVKRRFTERLEQVEIVPIEVASTLAPAIERSDEILGQDLPTCMKIIHSLMKF